MVINRGELDENQRTERDERIVELLTEAANALDGWGARDEMVKRLRDMAFEVHAALDPHCTCNDCLDEFERTSEGEPEGSPLASAPEHRVDILREGPKVFTTRCSCGFIGSGFTSEREATADATFHIRREWERGGVK